MNYLQDRQFTRASGLATALDEQLLHRLAPALAGEQPVGADSWERQRLVLADLLGALAWAVTPTPEERPDPNVLDQLPSGLIISLRERERAGEEIGRRLRRAAGALRAAGSLGPDAPLLVEIARRAEDEASDALRRMVEI
jgi:hypothetical protein